MADLSTGMGLGTSGVKEPLMDYISRELTRQPEEQKEAYISFRQRSKSQSLEWAIWFLADWCKKPFSEFDDDFLYALEQTLLGFDVDGNAVSLDEPYVRNYVSPRGFWKTTKCQFAILFLATEGVDSGQFIPPSKDESIFYLTQKDELAVDKMRPIWIELQENRAIKERYGDLMGDQTPKEGLYVRLKNKVIINAGGILGSRRGRHPLNLITDDLEEDLEVRSATTREKLWHRWIKELFPAMAPGARVFNTGNYIDESCLLKVISDLPGSVTTVRRALEKPGSDQLISHLEEGVSIQPGNYSKRWLLAAARTMGDYFWTEFMNDPRTTSLSPIKSHMIMRYDPKQMPVRWWEAPGFRILTFIDPAITKSDAACYTAIVTGAVGYYVLEEMIKVWEKEERARYHVRKRVEPYFYVIDARQGKWSSDETMDAAFNVFQEFHSTRVIMEESTASFIFEQLYSHRESTRNQVFPFELQPHNQFGPDKYSRIQLCAPYFRDQRVFINSRCAVQQTMAEQIIRFDPNSTSQKKDLADGFAGFVNNAAYVGAPSSAYEDDEEMVDPYERTALGRPL